MLQNLKFDIIQQSVMIINSSKKDVEVFCVALVTYKLTIIYRINDLSAKYVNLKKNLIIRRSGLSPSSGMVADEGLSPKRRIIEFFFKFTYFALGSLIS